MKALVRFSVRNPWVILGMTGLLVAAGLWNMARLPLDAVPDITNNQVQVNTVVEGLAPVQIEQQVTFPVEMALSGLPQAIGLRSITRPLISQVTVTFEDKADIYRARQLVSERLQSLAESLPAGARPELGPISTGLGEVYFYNLEAREIATGEERKEQLMRLREIQEWILEPRLLTVQGVAEVSASGGLERQAVVEPNPEIMRNRGIAFSDLVVALERANRYTGGGVIQQGGEQFSVSAIGALKSLGAIREVPVKVDQSLAAVRVGDVAEVRWGWPQRNGAATSMGRESLVCTVLMLAGENSRLVSSRIDEKIQELKGQVPDWAELTTLFNRTDLVDATLNTVMHNLLSGALLVILVLVFLLGNIRAALITTLTIPLSMLAAAILMNIFGISGNLMSLGAIDFGILVIVAVIILEHCVKLVSEARKKKGSKLDREEIATTVENATAEVSTEAGFGQLVIIVVLLPLFGLTGVEGKTFIPMVATLALALASAWIISFTVSPALAALFLSGDSEDKKPWLMAMASKVYEPLLQVSLKIPKTLALVGAGLLIVCMFLFPRLGAVFMPQLDEGSAAFQFVRPASISLSESINLQALSEQVILEFPEVKKVFTRIGTPEVATDVMGVNLGDCFVILYPRDEWPEHDGRKWTKDELVEAMSERMSAEIPGQRFLVTQPIQMRFNELLEGTRADVSVKIFGSDLNVLSELSAKVAAIVRQVPGAGDVEEETQGKTPILSIKPRTERLASMGVSTGEVLEAVETGLAGVETSLFYNEKGWRFPLVVRLAENLRTDLDALRELPVSIGESASRPLKDLAKISFEDSFPAIAREQTQRRSAVLINPRGRDVESFVLEAQERISESLKLPEGYFIQWGGSFENLNNAKKRLTILTPLALLLVFAMVYATFKDFFLAILVFAGVPLALVGGVLFLFVRGIPFSISAGVGFIALAGISVLNGVLLVGTSKRFFEGGMKSGEAIHEAAKSSLRPVLMTAMVEMFGFLPMMFSTGLGAEVQQPLATVVVGGVFSSAVLTLLMLPSWQTALVKWRDRKAPDSRKTAKSSA